MLISNLSTRISYWENLGNTDGKNGRLSRSKSTGASALKIKPVMGSTPEGTIYQLDQARGINKALVKMVDYVKEGENNSSDKVLAISHCNCPERAQMVKRGTSGKNAGERRDHSGYRRGELQYANDGGIIVVL